MPTIKIEKKEMVEGEITYPLFKEHGGSFYKITEDETIQVNCRDEKSFRIGKLCYTDLVIINGTDITEQHYNDAFMEVLRFVESKSPLVEGVFEPDPDDKAANDELKVAEYLDSKEEEAI